jgi:release factor glutamine methyltransferase
MASAMPEAAAVLGQAGRFGTARQAIAALSASFREAGLPTPELDARLLVLEACQMSPEDYMLQPETLVRMVEAELIGGFEARRIAREPVSRILGYREFWGRRFAIGPAVLDPRPDTETLIEAALALIGARHGEKPLRILDLGTGSGCVLVTLLAEMPHAWGIGSDISSQALGLARLNAERLGVASRAAFVQSDWAATFSGPFGLIISNPPYIERAGIDLLGDEVCCHDPQIALDGGTDGVAAYRRIIDDCARIAAPDAWVMLEVGRGKAPAVIDLFKKLGWLIEPDLHKVFQDLARIDRVVAIKRQAGGR